MKRFSDQDSPINTDKKTTFDVSNVLGSSSEVTMQDAGYISSVDTLQEDNEPRLKVKLLKEGKLPPYRAVFLIANAALGAGLLNFPQAFMNTGNIQTALCIEAVLLIFIIGAFLILARCANRSQAPTYQDLILYVLGPKFHVISQVFIFLYFFGTAITYTIIIGEQLSPVMVLITGGHEAWYSSKKFLFTIFALLILLPLCLPKKLEVLSYTSFFGGIGAFFITLVIVYKYFHYEIVDDYKTVKVDWKDSFRAIPVICFGFQCHVSSVAVYAELRQRNARKFFLCALVAMGVCSMTYSLSGSFGFMTFGGYTPSDILAGYKSNDVLVNVARVALVFILMSSFSIVTFCARTVVDDFVLRLLKYGEEKKERTERKRRILETLGWFAFALLLALVVPNISVAIALIGGIASTFIFVFPGLCLLKTINLGKLRLSKKDKLLIVIACIYIVFGAFIFGEVTTLALLQDIEGKNIM